MQLYAELWAHVDAVCEVTRWGPLLPGGPVLSPGDSGVGRQPRLWSCSLRAEAQPGLALDSAAPRGWGTGGGSGPCAWDLVVLMTCLQVAGWVQVARHGKVSPGLGHTHTPPASDPFQAGNSLVPW